MANKIVADGDDIGRDDINCGDGVVRSGETAARPSMVKDLWNRSKPAALLVIPMLSFFLLLDKLDGVVRCIVGCIVFPFWLLFMMVYSVLCLIVVPPFVPVAMSPEYCAPYGFVAYHKVLTGLFFVSHYYVIAIFIKISVCSMINDQFFGPNE